MLDLQFCLRIIFDYMVSNAPGMLLNSLLLTSFKSQTDHEVLHVLHLRINDCCTLTVSNLSLLCG